MKIGGRQSRSRVGRSVTGRSVAEQVIEAYDALAEGYADHYARSAHVRSSPHHSGRFESAFQGSPGNMYRNRSRDTLALGEAIAFRVGP